jgi:hypothetical protein
MPGYRLSNQNTHRDRNGFQFLSYFLPSNQERNTTLMIRRATHTHTVYANLRFMFVIRPRTCSVCSERGGICAAVTQTSSKVVKRTL